ncbi:hypothetical protein [Pedobacter frigiditerrae]|uniref:hypothetical protein n=1 Tax=Pedobacter frigiditerrae TaxID=2530452 RepID=UPI00292F3CBA|nr:hypothetical protein [Pedobacter frigiditerrae]
MDDLTGNLVMVHPKLENDPVNRQAQVGIITSADLAKDEVYVGFGNSPLGLYSTNALLVLKPHNDLYQDILTNIKNMDTPDFKTLMEITILQEKGSVNSLRDAIELAATNERTLAYSTVSLQDKLGLVREESHQQQITAGVGR